MDDERAPLVYRIVMAVATPIVRWWGRLDVVGLHLLPTSGPVVLIANHDSMWDPVVIGVAAGRRQVRALAKASLWRLGVVAWVLNRMGQIPIERGRGDLVALAAAVGALQDGHCVGIFAEGTVSRGRRMRALSGAGRLWLAVPHARVVGVAVVGSVDVVRFPHRPRLRVEFFEPANGQPSPGESAVGLTKRVMAEIRQRAPYAVPGRRRRAARYRAELAAPVGDTSST